MNDGRDVLARPPLSIDYAGATWTLIRPNKRLTAEVRHCEHCGRKLRPTAKCYRARRWGPNHDRTVYEHLKCLIGQMWPEVWDIP